MSVQNPLRISQSVMKSLLKAWEILMRRLLSLTLAGVGPFVLRFMRNCPVWFQPLAGGGQSVVPGSDAGVHHHPLTLFRRSC